MDDSGQGSATSGPIESSAASWGHPKLAEVEAHRPHPGIPGAHWSSGAQLVPNSVHRSADDPRQRRSSSSQIRGKHAPAKQIVDGSQRTSSANQPVPSTPQRTAAVWDVQVRSPGAQSRGRQTPSSTHTNPVAQNEITSKFRPSASQRARVRVSAQNSAPGTHDEPAPSASADPDAATSRIAGGTSGSSCAKSETSREGAQPTSATTAHLRTTPHLLTGPRGIRSSPPCRLR